MTTFAAIERRNQANLKAVDNGASVTYLFAMHRGQPLILIGSGHDPAAVETVTNGAHFDGVIAVRKGRLGDPGQLRVTGCRGRRNEFETALARFTKKDVVFA